MPHLPKNHLGRVLAHNSGASLAQEELFLRLRSIQTAETEKPVAGGTCGLHTGRLPDLYDLRTLRFEFRIAFRKQRAR
jgi:hypothetical protein